MTSVLVASCAGSETEGGPPAVSPPAAAAPVAPPQRRALAQLVVENDALRGFVEPLLTSADVDVVRVERDEARSAASLVRLQVTTHSTLGSLVYLTGGLVVDHGWLRIVGGPTDSFPYDPWSLAEALGLAGDDPAAPALLVVGIDRLGGLFALDGGVLGAPGKVFYFAPDSLRWDCLDINHSEFVQAMLTSRVETFYADSRWSGWQREVAPLAPTEGITAYPPPWTVEGRPLDRASRRPAPLVEIVAAEFDFLAQMERAR